MRYIKKGEEPKSLTAYKKDKFAYYDGYTEKDEIRENLMKDQGYLCGYCMRRIQNIKDVKIEHMVTQSSLQEEPRKALDYRIMLGVCYGNEKSGRKKECLTCDAHRGAKEIYVNPYDESSIGQIKYRSEGYITSDNEQIKTTLEDTLNLNYDGPDAYLVQNRKEVLDACKKKLIELQKTGKWTKGNVQKILNLYTQPDEEGKNIPYSGIAIWYLQNKLK